MSAARPRLATVEDVQQAQAEARRRADLAFFALFLALLGVVAGVGWVLIKSGDDAFTESCRMMQALDRIGADTAAAQARRDAAMAAWHASEGRRRLAAETSRAAAAEARLAATRGGFANSDCDDLDDPPATQGDTP